jgi:hypothetical protein
MDISVEGRTTMAEHGAAFYQKRTVISSRCRVVWLAFQALGEMIQRFFFNDNLFFKDLRCQNAYSILWPPWSG